MSHPNIHIELPDWVAGFVTGRGRVFASVEDRVALAIDLAAENVARGTGGPFGAAVFGRDSGELIAAGVNVVQASRCSAAHGEVMALSLAQQALGTHDLGLGGLPACELATSCEPCTMCLGATLWSGVARLLCAAREEDAVAVGFDEGPHPADWVAELNARGIEVIRDVLRPRARDVLAAYVRGGGEIYNSRQTTSE